MTPLDILKKAASLMSGETRAEIRGLINDLGLAFSGIDMVEPESETATA